MKKLFLFFTCVIIARLTPGQTKDLPLCKTINNELTVINNSFDNIVEKFKSKEDKISLVKTYFSEFSICQEKGKINDYGRKVEFIFYYRDSDYKGSKDEFTSFFEKSFKELNEAFGTSHTNKFFEEENSISYYFYERGKDISTSKRMIRLLLSYKDPADETEAYSVSLIFEYYPRR